MCWSKDQHIGQLPRLGLLRPRLPSLFPVGDDLLAAPSVQRDFNIVVSSPALPYDLQASKPALPEDWGMGKRLIGRQA
jgi:hypothetical protein